jgi:LPXTG-motif cell wall-anchored protein
MKVSKMLVLLISVGLFWVIAAPKALAEKGWGSTLHISEPTEIPGQVLPPGDYYVKVLNTKETRSFVQFMNTAGTEVVATVLAVPDYRVKTAEKEQFVYFQRPGGTLPALKSWVYPGNNWGVEFVYPKEKAVVLAEMTKEPVVATTSPKPDLEAEIVVVTPEKKEIKWEEYRSETVTTTKVAAKLPKTGSNLPFIALIGMASLVGAAVVRIVARRQA